MTNKRFLFGMLLMLTVLVLTGTSCYQFHNGTFTLTDIPPRFNGKYVFLETEDVPSGFGFLVGAYRFKVPEYTGTLPRISNGKVKIPMWMVSADETEIYGYKGSHKLEVIIEIYEKAEMKDEEEFYDSVLAELVFYDVNFVNGNAKVSFQDHDDIWEE